MKRIFLAASDIVMAPSTFPHVLCWWAAMAKKLTARVWGSPIYLHRRGPSGWWLLRRELPTCWKGRKKETMENLERLSMYQVHSNMHWRKEAWSKFDGDSAYVRLNKMWRCKEEQQGIFTILHKRLDDWIIGSWLDVKHDVLMFTHEQSSSSSSSSSFAQFFPLRFLSLSQDAWSRDAKHLRL